MVAVFCGCCWGVFGGFFVFFFFLLVVLVVTISCGCWL